jgi:hypothetical protein
MSVIGCRLVDVGFKFVIDYIALSLKKWWDCRFIVVGSMQPIPAYTLSSMNFEVCRYVLHDVRLCMYLCCLSLSVVLKLLVADCRSLVLVADVRVLVASIGCLFSTSAIVENFDCRCPALLAGW